MGKTIEESRKEVALDTAIKTTQLPVSVEELIKKAKKIENYLLATT